MSRRVEITLALPVVLPTVNRLRLLMSTFEPALPSEPRQQRAIEADVQSLMELFHPDFSNTGRIVINEAASPGILRACSFLRLQFRHGPLSAISDATLESGPDPIRYIGEEQSALTDYVFLATLQLILLQNISIPKSLLNVESLVLRGLSSLIHKVFRLSRSSTKPTHEPVAPAATRASNSWQVVVLNDPVNLMAYVVAVLQSELGLSEEIAQQRMREVHEVKSSTVWEGPRNEAEAYVHALQSWHLKAVLRNPADVTPPQ